MWQYQLKSLRSNLSHLTQDSHRHCLIHGWGALHFLWCTWVVGLKRETCWVLVVSDDCLIVLQKIALLGKDWDQSQLGIVFTKCTDFCNGPITTSWHRLDDSLQSKHAFSHICINFYGHDDILAQNNCVWHNMESLGKIKPLANHDTWKHCLSNL